MRIYLEQTSELSYLEQTFMTRSQLLSAVVYVWEQATQTEGKAGVKLSITIYNTKEVLNLCSVGAKCTFPSIGRRVGDITFTSLDVQAHE